MSPAAPDRAAAAPTAAELDTQLQQLQAALTEAAGRHAASPLDAAEREALKQQIIALFREADAALHRACARKEAVKRLAEQRKQIEGRHQARTATPGSSARVDHLGASTFVEKGWSRLSLLELEGAEAAFRRALELAPGHVEAETLLSWALMLRDAHDEAMQVLRGVLQREPQYPLAHVNVGYICLRKGIHGEAIEHLTSVIRADLDRRAVLYAHLYLGMAYREREMYDDAEGFFRKALELGPNLLQAWYELGRCYWFAGRHGDACLAWKTGSKANKFSPWGKRCAEVLDMVEQGGTPPRDG
ncbi:tetratricopeptide repeat protein [Gemmatimonas sp.]|uniref:tetratricopeptide repeat protein n=1 Tax=Gemmatimonas sp. TaxID=1962908 RepID=UPI00391F67CE